MLRLPDPHTQFMRRAERLRDLASRQASLADYLLFLARVAEAQHEAALALPVDVTANEMTGGLSDQTSTPLSVRRGVVPSHWRSVLGVVADACGNCGPGIGSILSDLEQASAERCDDWARAVLIGNHTLLPPGLAALIAAALQVEWTVLCAHIGSTQPQGTEHRDECPICGSLPVVGVIGIGGDAQGLRYLCCALCAAQWNLPRIRCIHCGSTESIAYYAIEKSNRAIRAEACGRCKAYSKILDLEREPGLEPFADDLASLPLDILLAEAGFERFGVNPFLIPGT